MPNHQKKYDYPTVYKRSQEKDIMAWAWEENITEKEAVEIIMAYLDESEFFFGAGEPIRFTATTGNARCEYHFKKIGEGMTLPATVSFRFPKESTRKLSLGLVLHEIAHALAIIDHKAPKHCDKFVNVLDGLLRSELKSRNTDCLIY